MGKAQPIDPVILRGILNYDGSVQFSLQCSQGRGSAWVREEQPFYGGRVVEYDSSEKSIVFVNNEGKWSIPLTDSYSSGPSIKFKNWQSNSGASDGQALKPFALLPTGLKKMPARDLIPLLVEQGYEVPAVVIEQRHSELEALQKESEELALANLASEGGILRPQVPKYTTSLTRNQKIDKNLIGYTDKIKTPSTEFIQDE